jgi:hypothetical protein
MDLLLPQRNGKIRRKINGHYDAHTGWHDSFNLQKRGAVIQKPEGFSLSRSGRPSFRYARGRVAAGVALDDPAYRGSVRLD